MPPDPKKPIEDLLEASARARRAAFGPAQPMPNPMRARLHDEIARLEKESGSQPARPRGLSTWWPRLTLAGALAVLLVGGPVLWLNRGGGDHSGHETLKLAIREPAGANAPISNGISATQESNDALKAEERVSPSVTAETATNADLADAKSVAAAAPVPAAEKAEENSSALQKFAQVIIPPPDAITNKFKDEQRQTQGAGKRAGGVVVAQASGEKMGVSNLRQQFSQNSKNQSARFASKLKQAVRVLNTFQIEQNGTEIRIVDADGSAYTGKIESVAQKTSRTQSGGEPQSYAAAPQTETTRRDKDEQSNNIEFSFRASGYNGSLKKRLVFEGNYIGAVASQRTDREKELGAASNGEQVPARIIGTARVNGESPMSIDAVSVAP
jgi:hypothetical protein